MRAQHDLRAVALLLAIAASTLACSKKKSSVGTHPDSVVNQQAEPPSDPLGDPPNDPLGELAMLEQRMQQLGLPIAGVVSPAEGERGPADGAAPAGAHADDVEEEPPRPAPEAAAAKRGSNPRAEAQRCADICDLSQAICQLEAQICSLSDDHIGDPTYADACRRAHEDCDTADTECDRCAHQER